METQLKRDESEISRLERADALGMSFVRTMIVLHGGALLALMTFLGNASAQTSITVKICVIKQAMTSFVVGICSILIALLISYTYTAAHPDTAWHRYWDRWVISVNAGMAIICIGSLIIGLVLLLSGVVET
ncbi:hypothetical protein [uncultured Tateyamaria sp.]|uniref:hypothetical protein n=1 Tax=uncultured Tateyamaria sp. TaxID=455651 RepID=UPI00260FB970|nr:hypothetical protein [uncultured Tateyamaria sp.]